MAVGEKFALDGNQMVGKLPFAPESTGEFAFLNYGLIRKAFIFDFRMITGNSGGALGKEVFQCA